MCLYYIFCLDQAYPLKGNLLVILPLHFGLYLGVDELDCVDWPL